MSAYRSILSRRYQRLCRLYAYKQDGRGNELSEQALLMVALCIEATKRELETSL